MPGRRKLQEEDVTQVGLNDDLGPLDDFYSDEEDDDFDNAAARQLFDDYDDEFYDDEYEDEDEYEDDEFYDDEE